MVLVFLTTFDLWCKLSVESESKLTKTTQI